MASTLRLIAFAPLALVASLLAGGFANTLAEFFGGSSWYGWLVGGLASAWAFFYVAFRVAPSPTKVIKWISVALVGGIGFLAAVGPLMTMRNPASALTGLAMLLMALYHARRPVAVVAQESVRPFL